MTHAAAKSSTAPVASFVTGRALVLGVALVVVNAFWQTPMSSILDIEITDLAMFSNVVAMFFALVLLNSVVKRVLPSFALQQRELLTIYAMLGTATALNGTDMIKALVSLVANGTWHATPENDWDNLIVPHLPQWLTVQDKNLLAGYYHGESSLYRDPVLRMWAPRAIAWTGFTVGFIFVMLCLNTLVRRQWVRNERLTYPIAQLPYELTESRERGSTLLRNRLLWTGFGVATLISVINQLHVSFPVVPAVPVQPFNMLRFFQTKPWNAMSHMNYTMYPFAVGLAYLMPLDLIVSTWFFHLFWQAERVFGSSMGFAHMPGIPYAEAQIRGGWVALLVATMWIGRRHFANVARLALRPNVAVAHEDLSDEPMSYRAAVIGAVAGTFGLIVFCGYMGMSLWLLVPFFILFFAYATTITRIRAELGPSVHTISYATPDTFLVMGLGTRGVGQRNLVGFTMLHWVLGSSGRENPMPIQLEAFKFAERANLRPRGLIAAILLAAGVGSLAGWWAYLHDAYIVGIDAYPEESWAASTGFNLLNARLLSLGDPEYVEMVFAGVGFLFTAVLSLVRTRFLWWPLHPVGYVISGQWDVGRILVPLIVASVLKWLILKFTGVGGYRRSTPFFFGLILGDFGLGSLWATLGVLTHMPV
ncbi:MAG: hypothetical protein O3A46_17445, partial [Candidatus Poribacteria bacterium]|nr:hypothetical protein [Candidatus Poribacteria bacterium]